ncbi:MAG: hypothetical protein BWZ02_02606 [Lentisphaerae bacterium ADurb.BinA184]|nr:MAG: hypothetical protein BWZ02_02606 [Lentisphaerae bacterium ADurb.BinA184]
MKDGAVGHVELTCGVHERQQPGQGELLGQPGKRPRLGKLRPLEAKGEHLGAEGGVACGRLQAAGGGIGAEDRPPVGPGDGKPGLHGGPQVDPAHPDAQLSPPVAQGERAGRRRPVGRQRARGQQHECHLRAADLHLGPAPAGLRGADDQHAAGLRRRPLAVALHLDGEVGCAKARDNFQARVVEACGEALRRQPERDGAERHRPPGHRQAGHVRLGARRPPRRALHQSCLAAGHPLGQIRPLERQPGRRDPDVLQATGEGDVRRADPAVGDGTLCLRGTPLERTLGNRPRRAPGEPEFRHRDGGAAGAGLHRRGGDVGLDAMQPAVVAHLGASAGRQRLALCRQLSFRPLRRHPPLAERHLGRQPPDAVVARCQVSLDGQGRAVRLRA